MRDMTIAELEELLATIEAEDGRLNRWVNVRAEILRRTHGIDLAEAHNRAFLEAV